jgi:fibronectin-binding autotransporter adhesin
MVALPLRGRRCAGNEQGWKLTNITNLGTVSGLYGYQLTGSSSVTNGSPTDLTASITGTYAALSFTGPTGDTNSVTNYGKIAGGSSGTGIAMGNQGNITIVNGTTSDTKASITGFNGLSTNAGTTTTTLANYASITGTNYAAIISQGTITNGSAQDTAATISGAYAVTVGGGAGTVNNFGNITGGANGYGVVLDYGGSITNGSSTDKTASITGSYAVEGGGGATITNYGTIKGGYQAIIASGKVINYGSIIGGSSGVAISFNPGGRLVEEPGSTITGAVIGGGNTLELASGASAGSITNLGSGTALSGFGTVDVDAGSTWTFNGTNTVGTIINNGTAAIAAGGSLSVTSSVDPSSSGVFLLKGNATFDVAAALGTNEKIQFLSGTTGNKLTIDKTSSFGTHVGTSSYAGALLENFAAGDIIDLKGISNSGLQLAYSSSSNDLQVTGSGGALATLKFQGSTLGAGSFHIASDGSGGTFITHS